MSLGPSSNFEHGTSPRTRITIRQYHEIRKLRQSGKTLTQIAELLGLNKHTIRHHCRDLKSTVVFKYQVVGKLADAGLSNATIAERLGIPIGHVKSFRWRWRLHSAGLPLPRRIR